MPYTNDKELFIKRLTEIIHTNISNEQFGVTELAQAAGMSRSNLHRRVKAFTGQSASTFICNIKLDLATRLLKESTKPVSEIAFECGFHSATYFSKCFRDRYGFPPGEARNHVQENERHQDFQGQKAKRVIAKKRIPIFYSLATLFILILVTTTFIVWKPVKRVKMHADRSIAVLPFINDSPEESEMYFINGAMEEILNGLGKIEGLRVISRTSMEQYRDRRAPVNVIARELKVSYILEGSGLKIGDQIKLNLQLIDAESDSHVWVKSYSSNVKEIFALYSEIAQSVAEEMEATITSEERRQIETPPTSSQIAYEFYLKGREEYGKFEKDLSNLEALQRSEVLTRYAMEYDPEFVRPYVRLAWIYNARYNSLKDTPDTYLDSIRKYAFRAVAINDRDYDALYVRGHYFFISGQLDKARRDYTGALEIYPNLQAAYSGLGWIAYVQYDLVESIRNLHRAVLLAPGQPQHLNSLGVALRTAGIKEQSDECFRRALQINGDSATYYFHLGHNEQYINGNLTRALALCQQGYSIDSSNIECLKGISEALLEQGRFEESLDFRRKYLEQLDARNAIDLFSSGATGFIFQMNGDQIQADRYFDNQIKYSERSLAVSDRENLDLVIVHALRGDTGKAMECLRALNRMERMNVYSTHILQDDLFCTSIQDNPEFRRIRSDINAKYQAEHDRVRQWLAEHEIL